MLNGLNTKICFPKDDKMDVHQKQFNPEFWRY